MAAYGSQYRSRYGSSSMGLGENKRSPLLDSHCWLERTMLGAMLLGCSEAILLAGGGILAIILVIIRRMGWFGLPPPPGISSHKGTGFRGYTRPREWDGSGCYISWGPHVAKLRRVHSPLGGLTGQTPQWVTEYSPSSTKLDQIRATLLLSDEPF